MKLTVCELPNDRDHFTPAWERLVEHVGERQSDIVLLPEMPFYRWLSQTKEVDPTEWQRAVDAHDEWIPKLVELEPAIVISSRPVIEDGARRNVGFVWEPGAGAVDIHAKHYLPDEAGFWEASWYQRGDGSFSIAEMSKARVGFLICTELWFTAHARAYAAQGIHILVCPRATPHTSVDTWVTGGRTAAVVSGAFCLSSNFNGPHVEDMAFGGAGWIIEPEAGHVLGLTSDKHPFLTIDIDLSLAEHAKQTYPRYVPD